MTHTWRMSIQKEKQAGTGAGSEFKRRANHAGGRGPFPAVRTKGRGDPERKRREKEKREVKKAHNKLG